MVKLVFCPILQLFSLTNNNLQACEGCEGCFATFFKKSWLLQRFLLFQQTDKTVHQFLAGGTHIALESLYGTVTR